MTASAPALPLHADDLITAVAWLQSIPGFSPDMADSSLPPDAQADGSPSPWVSTGFCVADIVGGAPSVYMPLNQPVVSLTCYATLPGSNDPPWQLCRSVANAITLALQRREPRQVVPSVNGVEYPLVTVHSAYQLQGWRPVYEDNADYACLNGSMVLEWTEAGITIP